MFDMFQGLGGNSGLGGSVSSFAGGTEMGTELEELPKKLNPSREVPGLESMPMNPAFTQNRMKEMGMPGIAQVGEALVDNFRANKFRKENDEMGGDAGYNWAAPQQLGGQGVADTSNQHADKAGWGKNIIVNAMTGGAGGVAQGMMGGMGGFMG